MSCYGRLWLRGNKANPDALQDANMQIGQFKYIVTWDDWGFCYNNLLVEEAIGGCDVADGLFGMGGAVLGPLFLTHKKLN